MTQFRDLSSDTDVYCFCRRPDDSKVLSSPAKIQGDIREAKDALCCEVGVGLNPHCLFGDLHPALLLYCRVQAYLVSYLSPDSRQGYRNLPG